MQRASLKRGRAGRGKKPAESHDFVTREQRRSTVIKKKAERTETLE